MGQNTNPLLPAGFEALAAFVPDWVLPDMPARMARRRDSTIEELRLFYTSIVPLGDAALDHLRGFPLGQLPPDSANLLGLMLSLAEIGPAVEWYDSPQVTDSFSTTRVQVLRVLSDTAGQR